MSINKLLSAILAVALSASVSLAQDIRSVIGNNTEKADTTSSTTETQLLNPIDTVKEFYRLLREKRYVEGFRLSVYRDAIESLDESELKELEPEFENTFANIPAEIKVLGSQANGRTATVFIKANDNPKDLGAEEVLLLQVNNRWVIGDDETLEMVKKYGRSFFFEIRMRVNEDQALQFMERYIGAEKLYYDANKGVYGTHEELVKASFWPPSFKSGEMYGYKFTIEVAKDKKSFWVHAEPLQYKKTGVHSFYADLNGVRKFDNSGKVYRVELKGEGK